MRKTFVVGKLTGRTAEILLLEPDRGVSSGPRTLQALVRSLGPATSARPAPGTTLSPALACPATVH